MKYMVGTKSNFIFVCVHVSFQTCNIRYSCVLLVILILSPAMKIFFFKIPLHRYFWGFCQLGNVDMKLNKCLFFLLLVVISSFFIEHLIHFNILKLLHHENGLECLIEYWSFLLCSKWCTYSFMCRQVPHCQQLLYSNHSSFRFYFYKLKMDDRFAYKIFIKFHDRLAYFHLSSIIL